MDTEQIAVEEATLPKPTVGFVLLAPGTIASDYSLQSLNKALGEAQNEFLPAVKGEENKFIGYKYVPLESIIAAVRPSLTKFHLTVSQFPVVDLEMKTISLYTRLVHWDSGEWFQSELILPAELALGKDGAPKFNQQTIGGSQTYAQKYAYKAILGVPDSEEMIDGTDEKGDLPSRQKRVTPASVIKTAISQQPAGASAASWGAQPSTQRPANAPAAYQGQAGGIKFIPPNGLTTTIKGVRLVAAVSAEGDRKATRPYLVVTFLGMHNGVNFASCFDTKYWDLLEASVGLECHFQIKEADKNNQHFINIVDVIYVDGEEYKDGLPVTGAAQ